MYAAFVTLKNGTVITGPEGTDIASVTEEGKEVPFDATIPRLRIRYNYAGNITHPVFRNTVIELSAVAFIGRQYYPCPDEQAHLYITSEGITSSQITATRFKDPEEWKRCRRCGSENVPAARVASLCNHCLSIVHPEDQA